ncbi:MAG: DNA polymerase III subunit alpha [Flavobacteriales bacterium]|nr:DNA polymerase III subunit alpha [Flavobacteriales bacterium]
MYLIFDTETTGLPINYKAPLSDFDNWPRMVQLAWQLHDVEGNLVEVKNYIVKPEGYTIPFNAEKIHGISTTRAEEQGMELSFVLAEFNKALEKAKFNVGHNIDFDVNIVGCELLRKEISSPLSKLKVLDTMTERTAEVVAIPGGRGGKFKFPKLGELHQKLFGESFEEAHNASADVEATARCFLELIRIGIYSPKDVGMQDDEFAAFLIANPKTISAIGLNIQPYDPRELDLDVQKEKPKTKKSSGNLLIDPKYDVPIEEINFTHLHNHTQYSVLQATTNMKALMDKAVADGMKAVALTDRGNMYGAFQFTSYAISAGLKPIVGCEVYVSDDYTRTQFTKDVPDRRFPLVLLAKDKKAYHNLTKIVSEGYIQGFYAGVPRVGREVIEQYKEGLMCLSGGVNAELPQTILNIGESQGEEILEFWHNMFGNDYYVELVDHGLEEEKYLNKVLVNMAHKHGVKVVAANNNFYLDKKDANAHDILICVKEGELQSTPIGRGRGFRPGMPNQEFYFKTQDQMKEIFKDFPEALANTMEIADKVEPFKLDGDILLPKFGLPEGFEDENDYLRHLTYEGAKTRYPVMTDEIRDRLDFELKIVKEMGFPGYFLIVQDFTSQARKMGVSVGPGRGSAAGSAIAYCVGVTNIDPIKYKLLFERFLNPDRVSMPDIDIDFDDEGRGAIIDWVVEKYGYKQVAQIVTYGTMAAKSAIKDVGRVMDVPLIEVNAITKSFPDNLSASLAGILEEKGINPGLKEKLNSDQVKAANEFREKAFSKGVIGDLIMQAKILEGSVRNTGTHACGVIIAPDDLTNYIPVSTSKDSALLITQFDNKVVESAGLLKMDFLGLKTLTVIKHAIQLIKDRHGIEIDIDTIPLDDIKTFELYQRGETNGTFQFESPGMQKHLRNLKPTDIEDLIAMNALYRPGPLQFIDLFIKRKHGKEPTEFPHPLLEPILKDTYGIMVYQEQIMQTAQIIGGFSLGQADLLRRAMGKKKMDVMQSQKKVFAEGALKLHQMEEGKANEIFDVMLKFAEYGFNRSHSAAYSVVAFQTAYLKANYLPEFMAAVLTNNMNDIKKVSFFMEECKRIGVPVLGPDVNESKYRFAVNEKGEIRFGMGAIKGVGEGAVDSIIKERLENGPYTSIFDFTKRVDLRASNKRTLESLAMAGGFDSFPNTHRAQYFFEEGGSTFLEKAIKFGATYQESENSAQVSLFGEASSVSIPEPNYPICTEWGTMEKLSKERDVVGIFISGHPLDDFKLELNHFATKGFHLGLLGDDLTPLLGKEFKFGGIVTESDHRISAKGKPWGLFKMEDYQGDYEFRMFGDDYLNFKQFLTPNYFLFVYAKVIPNRYRNEPELKITKISILNDLRDKFAQEITLKVEMTDVNSDLIDALESLINGDEGKCKVKMTLIDKNESLSAEGILRGRKVHLSDDLISKLEMLQIDYSIN